MNAEQTFAAMSLACHLFFHDRERWPTSLGELVPAYLPHQSVDPWGDGHQIIGYVIVKAGLPDGADRPMVYSRCGIAGKLFYRVDEPEYGFYTNDGTNADRPHHNPSGQFRDVASCGAGGGRGGGADDAGASVIGYPARVARRGIIEIGFTRRYDLQAILDRFLSYRHGLVRFHSAAIRRAAAQG